MRGSNVRAARAALLLILSLSLGSTAAAQAAAALETRALVATCANCHGTDGKAVAGEAMPQIAGLPKEYIVAQMQAFRDGSRPATIMHQLTKGYSNQQIDAIAGWLAARK